MDNNEHKTTPYRRRLAELKRESDQWLPLWRDLNEFILPWSGRFLFSDEDVKAIRRGEHVYDSSVYNAIQTAASGLHGGLTSPSRPWFEITHQDRKLMENSAVKDWIYDLQMNERRVLSQSNFYAKIQALYYEALAYGQAAMLIEKDWETTVRVRALTCGEYHLANGADLRVNTVYRKFAMTADQMRQEFDERRLSRKIRDALEGNRLDEVFYVIQAIQPWGMFDGKKHPEWKYESVYFEEAADDRNDILDRRGYRSQPFVAVRWNAIGDNVYGFGPGEMALADVRQLQTMQRAYVNAVNWIADPAWLVSETMKDRLARGEIRPGAIVPASATEGKDLFRPLVPGNFDFNNIRAKIEEVQDRIRSAFYNPLFLMVASREREMTATEVQQLVEEKATVLGPVLEAFQSEIFDPILERVYDIMENEFHIVPPPPEELRGGELKIEYVSLLAQAQRQAGLSNLNHFLAVVGQVLAIAPQSAAKVNFDEAIDTLYSAVPVNPSIIRSDEEVAAIREQEAQQMAQQQQAESIPAMAGAAKDLSEAQPAPDNLAGMLAGMQETA